jgi:hypothetical protein
MLINVNNEFMWRRDERWLGPFVELVEQSRIRANSRTL